MRTILYHGSHRRFDHFSKDVHPRYDNPQRVIGHFLTDDPEYALRYATGEDGTLYVVECTFDNLRHEPLLGGTTCLMWSIERNWTVEEAIVWADGLESAGHDGVMFDTNSDFKEYALFHDDQLSIRHALSGDEARAALAEDRFADFLDAREPHAL